MSRCKHTNTETRWHQDRVRPPPPGEGPVFIYVETLRCVDCGELCSMGPSQTEDRVEVWAALLTSERECSRSQRRYLPPYTMASLGWRGIVCPPEIESTLYLAGHLARCIYDHDELQRTGDP